MQFIYNMFLSSVKNTNKMPVFGELPIKQKMCLKALNDHKDLGKKLDACQIRVRF